MQSSRLHLLARRHIWPTGLRRFSFSPISHIEVETNEFISPDPTLDPSLQALLKDVDMSVKKARNTPPAPQKVLEVVSENMPFDDPEWDTVFLPHGRKSPAASFGSKQLGAVHLPLELQKTINMFISEIDKRQLREDAKRLFIDDDSERWDTQFNEKYRSFQQARRTGDRDGAAFAAIALPAHFSAIFAVLEHIKHRLGADHRISSVMDWGSATGSGFWAAAYAFQSSQPLRHDELDLHVQHSSLVSYVGIDKREGLTRVARYLLKDINLDGKSVSFQKSYKPDDKVPREDGREHLALSAFQLSSLPTPLARKQLVKEMWDSGADLLVLIDHNTPEGFNCIAEARSSVLRMANKEFADPDMHEDSIRGAHVIAPCPHDRECPLHQPNAKRKLVCGFSQRLQRPDFVRKTKHSKFGHEDIEYSYVVIRRGARPSPPTGSKVGRIGEIGRREIEKELEKEAERIQAQAPRRELALHVDSQDVDFDHESLTNNAQVEPVSQPDAEQIKALVDLENTLRQEAYVWPRVVFPPIKAQGHIILDSCTAQGRIMRMTIPKSQGKQPYYDARKSSWGDLFPHKPKNKPQVRYVPQSIAGDAEPITGSDIGKRQKVKGAKDRHTYEGIAEKIKDWKKSRRDATMKASRRAEQEEL